MTAHLDSKTWHAFLEGALDPGARRALADHLEAGCDTCEAFLADAATRGEVDPLDGVVDDALYGLAPSEPLRDDLAFERIRREVRRPARTLTRVAAGLVGAVAAAAAVALLVVQTGQPVTGPGTSRLKGHATAPATRLEVYRAGAAGTALTPVAPGSRVPVGSTLVFRVHLDAPGCVQLWRRDHGPEPLLDAPVCLPAGSHVLEHQGATLGLPLAKAGTLDLWLVPETGAQDGAAVRRKLAAGEAVPGADHLGLTVAPAEAPEVP